MNDLDGLRDETLSRLYREAATAEPPARLDAAILAAARAEAVRSALRRPPSVWRRWRLAASFATVATLALALSLIVPREMERAEQALPMEAAEPRHEPRVPAAAGSPTTVDKATQAEQAPPAAAPAASVPRPEPKAAKREAAPPPPGAPSPSAGERNIGARPSFGQQADPWPGAKKAQPESREAVGAAAPPMATPPPEPLHSLREPASPPAPARALPAPAPAHEAAKGVEDESVSADTAGAAAPAVAPKARLRNREQAPRSPEAWLEEIRRLRRAGQDEQAGKALAEFRRAYPAFALPEDLRSIGP